MSKPNERSSWFFGILIQKFGHPCYSIGVQNAITFFLQGVYGYKKFWWEKSSCFFKLWKHFLILSVSQLSLSVLEQKRRFFASKCHIMVGNRQTHIFFKIMKTLNDFDAFSYPKRYKRTISGDFMIIWSSFGYRPKWSKFAFLRKIHQNHWFWWIFLKKANLDHFGRYPKELQIIIKSSEIVRS